MSRRLPSFLSGTIERPPGPRLGCGRWLPALLALLTLCLAPTARGEEAVAVRAGLHDGFGRLVLEWPASVEVMGRQEGGRYRLRFARPFAADLNAALRHLNEYLAGAATGPDRRELLLDLAPGVEVRQRVAQGRIVILDLARVAPGESAHQVEVRTGLHDGFGRLVFEWPVPVAFDALTAGRHMAIRFDRLGHIDLSTVSARLRAWLEDAGATRRDGQSVVRLDLHEGASARVFRVDDHRVVVDLSIASRATAERAAPPPSSVPRPVFRPTEPFAPATEPGPVTTAAATSGSAEAPGGDAGAAHLTIASGTDAAGAYLDFAWTRTVGAAVFVRAGHLWVVFAAETSRPDHVVVPPMVAALRDDLGPAERIEANGGIALRFALRRPLGFEVSGLDRIWRVRPIPDAPVAQIAPPRRTLAPSGLRLAPGESPRLVTLRDPEVGDELTVWPLQQANGGQPRQRLVDVELLATAQGLAWRVRRDGVETRVGTDAVEFVAPGGLILSEQARIEAPQSDDAVAPLQHPGDTSAPPPDRARTGPPQPDHAFSEPPPPRAGDGEAVVEPSHGVIGLVGPFEETRGGGSVQPREGGAPTAADEHRLERARGYLSRAMAAEALGVLGTFERSGDAATGRAQQALRGAAELIMGRIDEADTILGASEFDHDPEVALWRMAIAAAREDWPEAMHQLQRSDRVLAAYPRSLRLRLGLAAARAAIETHETEFADTLLEQLNAAEPTPAERARLTFLEGLAEARKGAIATADRIWQALEQTGPADVRVDAALARTEMLLDAGRLNPAAAIARLAPTRALWRGHPREAAMLAALAEMYDDAGDRPNALRTWRELLDRHPGTAQASALVERVRATLIEVLLADGEDALGPLQAYALFREFAALIPQDAAGDRVRRRIARHLAELDLIRPAAVLLGVVVERLTGIDQADAGADLAELWLDAGEPDAVLAALEHSEGDARLPAELRDRRQILRADALARRGRESAALALLDDLEVPAADDLRVDILWRQQDWPRLIAALEDALERRTATDAGLGERERVMVVRLAIANGRLGESDALDRLRARFAKAFEGHALEPAFLLATASHAATNRPDAVLAAAERHLHQVRGYLDAARHDD